MVRSQALALFVLRAGVAFAFLYAGVDSFAQPYSWVDYLPQALTNAVPALALLHLFAALEILLALWLVSGWHVRYPALLCAALLVAIVALNGAEFQLLFRDLSIAAAALAVAVDTWRPAGGILQ